MEASHVRSKMVENLPVVVAGLGGSPALQVGIAITVAAIDLLTKRWGDINAHLNPPPETR